MYDGFVPNNKNKKMNLKSFLLTVSGVFVITSTFAQANILNAKKP